MRKNQEHNQNEALRTQLLEAALPDIAFDGWTDVVLENACKKTGISAQEAETALPDGIASLALHFSTWADQKMLARLKKTDLAKLRVRDRIALGVRTRLEILMPWKQAVSTATSYLGLSPRGMQMPQIVWHTADKIWWAAGDTATDYNHYTKRFLLSGVLTTTTLYWLNDDSDDHADTWAFLDRRIDNVLKVGRTLGSIGGFFRRDSDDKASHKNASDKRTGKKRA